MRASGCVQRPQLIRFELTGLSGDWMSDENEPAQAHLSNGVWNIIPSIGNYFFESWFGWKFIDWTRIQSMELMAQ